MAGSAALRDPLMIHERATEWRAPSKICHFI